ncbi:MAG: DUF6910 family protein [Rubrivivax sp.]
MHRPGCARRARRHAATLRLHRPVRALPGGGWVFCAAAEDTDDSVADGHCTGSAVGWVDAADELWFLQPLSLSCKAEGIAAVVDGATAKLLLVTDANDRDTAAWLLAATLSLNLPCEKPSASTGTGQRARC